MTSKVQSRFVGLRSFRPKLASVAAIGFLAFLAPAVGQAASCEQISTMRDQLRQANTAIAKAQAEKVIDEQPEFSAEEQGCISDYMPQTGLGLPGFSDLLEGLKDAACSAADAYLGSQLSQLGASLTGPLDMANADIGFGEDKCAGLTGEEKRKCSNFKISQSDVGVDYDGIMGNIKDKLPKLENDLNKDLDYSGGQRAGDYYLNQGRGTNIDYNPAAGGRR